MRTQYDSSRRRFILAALTLAASTTLGIAVAPAGVPAHAALRGEGAPQKPLRGAEAKRKAERSRVAWGDAAHGLQLGIAISAEKRRFMKGDQVPLELYIRNVSPGEVSFSYLVAIWPFDTLLYPPQVRTENGQPLHVPEIGLGGYPTVQRETLGPDGVLVLSHPGLKLGEPGPGAGVRAPLPKPYLADVKPGEYRLIQRVRLDIAGAPAHDSGYQVSTRPDGQGFQALHRLTSGELRFEIGRARR